MGSVKGDDNGVVSALQGGVVNTKAFYDLTAACVRAISGNLDLLPLFFFASKSYTCVHCVVRAKKKMERNIRKF